MKTSFGLFLTLLIATASYCNAARLNVPPLSEELVRYVNNHPDSTWKAAMTNRFSNIEDAKILLGALIEDPTFKQLRRPTVTHEDKTIKLPDSFDAREAWPFCPSIGHIRDQSACGSCWALGAVEAMSDRICIHKSTHLNKSLSARDLMSCCQGCGDGCEGGFLGPSWDYWVEHGIVTGGDYNDTTTCLPYPFPQCQHHSKGPYANCSKEIYDTPKCVNVCENDYHKPYRYDLIKGKSSYNVDSKQEAIMKEIQLNGPVEAAFDVYSDFLNYKSGVYKHLTDDYLGGHAIRILGWGVEKDVPYWLCANSWNDAWGDKGYFKILRGSNECEIEDDVAAGLI